MCELLTLQRAQARAVLVDMEEGVLNSLLRGPLGASSPTTASAACH